MVECHGATKSLTARRLCRFSHNIIEIKTTWPWKTGFDTIPTVFNLILSGRNTIVDLLCYRLKRLTYIDASPAAGLNEIQTVLFSKRFCLFHANLSPSTI